MLSKSAKRSSSQPEELVWQPQELAPAFVKSRSYGLGFHKRQRLVLIVALSIGLMLLTAQGTSAAISRETKANLNLYTCANSACGLAKPNPIPKGTSITIYCKIRGEVINSDPWWLRTCCGYVSDYYVDCGGVVCPVPNC